jgi:tetratricopeptide (TPR) repeat protein
MSAGSGMAGIIVRAMIDRLTAPLREAPSAVPALAAVALFVAWATNQAGYPLTHWAPGGLIILVLLLIALGSAGARVRDVPRAVKVAVGCLAGYTAFSFLSIVWAGEPGIAWEGADRTLLYLLVFTLFAWWPHTGRSAALVICAWTLSMAGLAGYVALHVDAASASQLTTMLPGGRLLYPSGYANANAAEWLMAAWPALLLARSERLPWALRGLLAGSAVLLAEVALLSQSRGSLYATPVMLVLVFALLPGRARTFLLLVPVAAGIGGAATAVLRVGDDLQHGAVVPGTLHHAITAILIASLATALVVAAGAALEGRLVLSARSTRRARTAIGIVAAVTLLAVVAVGWAAAGDPAARVKHAWQTFKSPRGYAANSAGSRLTSGLGSQRYDFYRVSLDEFAAHPVLGIGADNFQEAYLRERRSGETPHYPHSVEFRTLAQTGLLGAALALIGLAAALLAAARAAGVLAGAGTSSLGRTVGAAAVGGFGYWLVHGSFDWFFEFAGLGAPAFALLGLAAALVPRAGSEQARRAAPIGRRRAAVTIAVLTAAAAGVSFALPWLSRLQLESAGRIWPTAPLEAYARLHDAADLDPLSDDAYLLAGSIAVRFGDLARAEREFSLALGRVPGDSYATLELGAIASARGEAPRARVLLRRAVRLDPRDRLTRAALAAVVSGRRVNVDELNRLILVEAHQLA